MRVEISGQLTLFLASFICGCVLSLFYDLIRLGRMTAGVVYGGVALPQRSELDLPLIGKRSPPKQKKSKALSAAVLVFLGDVLFFSVAAFALLCVFFNYGGGKVRGMGMFLAAVGFILSHYTVGAVMINIFALLKLGAEVACEYLLFFVLLPVRKLLLPLFKKVFGAICGSVNELLLRLYTKKQEKKMLSVLCGLKER